MPRSWRPTRLSPLCSATSTRCLPVCATLPPPSSRRLPTLPRLSATFGPQTTAPPASTDEAQAELDTVELKLRELKRWLDEGLITPEQYEAKRAELLEGL